MNARLIHGDCLEVMKQRDFGHPKCIFMDPPDNLKLGYDGYEDDMEPSDYIQWLASLVWLAQSKSDIVWISFNAIHDLALTRAMNVQPGFEFRRIIWYFTFGQYRTTDFAHNYRPIIRLTRNGTKTYPDAIRVESERMRIGDARAAGPRVPGDIWDFPRVVGNSKERQDWHPTQHPVALYDRVIKYSCQGCEDFVDLFAGSGTCFRAALLNPETHVLGIEKSKNYCDRLLLHNPEVRLIP
jgi:DNA modification methylase